MTPLPKSRAAKTALFIVFVTSGPRGRIEWKNIMIDIAHQEKLYTLTYAKLGQIAGVFEHGRARGIILKDSGSYLILVSWKL